MTNLRMSRRA
ncbi:uncharacterized protein CELE_C08B6.18 [Caenorhabditis elegans]|uniref:Uncharacterized protein n=1 Tax=Caenorhabditis elegans TaxID=6239 RepID=A0A2K5ATW6_CAEEL|nr:Uncharacterized protein CELE_C08B6.18 [Caenorhabditis elegans]SPC47955.2 Uncharacterized protein CELE_C08B6.18 [Caenorhabditis elegans]|eukprot:NP_001348766.2 Uncharacterized protein CELE_C08B6.18 [Caenorhabditis elegans]